MNEYEAVYSLWQLFLHMECWGRPEYERLDPDERTEFSRLVNDGTVFEAVEDCKRLVLSQGVNLSNQALCFLAAHTLAPGVPLSEASRAQAAEISFELYPLMVRLGTKEQGKPEGETPSESEPETLPGVAPRNRWFMEQYDARGTDTYPQTDEDPRQVGQDADERTRANLP